MYLLRVALRWLSWVDRMQIKQFSAARAGIPASHTFRICIRSPAGAHVTICYTNVQLVVVRRLNEKKEHVLVVCDVVKSSRKSYHSVQYSTVQVPFYSSYVVVDPRNCSWVFSARILCVPREKPSENRRLDSLDSVSLLSGCFDRQRDIAWKAQEARCRKPNEEPICPPIPPAPFPITIFPAPLFGHRQRLLPRSTCGV